MDSNTEKILYIKTTKGTNYNMKQLVLKATLM